MSVQFPRADDNDGFNESVAMTACETRPGRVVFTVSDNPDGWIASDLSITPER